MAVRVLHFADVHIGMENFGRTDANVGVSGRVLDFLHRMDDMIEFARDNEVDLVIFAGDAFKNSTPSPTYQREFAHRISDLAKLAPVVMLVGNHDLQPNANKASSIEIYETLAVPNIWVAGAFEVKQIETRNGNVIVGAAPYPSRSRLIEQNGVSGKTIRQIEDNLREVLIHMIEDLAQQADSMANGTTPRMLVGHFTVAGAMLGSERQVMLGRDVDVPLNVVADSRWDYVALGHIHKHQNMTRKHESAPPVVYSGSIERIDFGEEDDKKGFCWLELERNNTAWQFIPLKKVRPMLTIHADCRNDNMPTQTVIRALKQHKLAEAIVRLRIEFTPTSEALFKEEQVREALRQAGVYYIAGIEHRLERAERLRLGVSPEGLSHEELLDKYFISKSVDSARRQQLLALAQDLMKREV
jgi:DNA repair protein SbcD/Mre11